MKERRFAGNGSGRVSDLNVIGPLVGYGKRANGIAAACSSSNIDSVLTPLIGKAGVIAGDTKGM